MHRMSKKQMMNDLNKKFYISLDDSLRNSLRNSLMNNIIDNNGNILRRSLMLDSFNANLLVESISDFVSTQPERKSK